MLYAGLSVRRSLKAIAAQIRIVGMLMRPGGKSSNPLLILSGALRILITAYIVKRDGIHKNSYFAQQRESEACGSSIKPFVTIDQTRNKPRTTSMVNHC